MKKLIASLAITLLATAAAAEQSRSDYPSCDLKAQRALAGQVGGEIKDSFQAHVSMRANVLDADIGNARKARHITTRQVTRLQQRVDRVSRDATALARKQGFLSAAERATYDRTLDSIAMELCR